MDIPGIVCNKLIRSHLFTPVFTPRQVTATMSLSETKIRKLEPDPSRPRYFVTESGLGYRFIP